MRGWAYRFISDDLITRAKVVQQMLRNPTDWMMGDIKIRVIMAKNRHTRIKVKRRNNGTFDPDILPKQMGDTLVPHEVTIKWVGPHITPYVVTYQPPVKEHSRLFNDPGVMGVIKGFLRT